MSTAKTEALDTLNHLQKMLDAPEPLTGLRLSQFRATLEYAYECVTKICETKRPRRTPKEEKP